MWSNRVTVFGCLVMIAVRGRKHGMKKSVSFPLINFIRVILPENEWPKSG
jgi:hypothetical protein